ncbi:STAS domain-containing protein [Actinosynnema sp. CA-248983]
MTGDGTSGRVGLARVETEVSAGVATARFEGQVDAVSHQHVSGELRALLDRHPVALVLDLRRVTFLASIGIAVLVNAHHAARRLGVAFAVVADNRAVLRPLAAAQVDHVLPVHPTPAAALAAVRLATT